MLPMLSSRRLRIAAAVAALLTSTAGAQAAPVGATVLFDAQLAKMSSVAHVPFKAGGVEWTCSTTHCAGKGPGGDPLGTCKAVTKQVGPLKSFTAAGRAVDLNTCGALPPPMVAAPMKSAVPVAAAPVGAAAHAAPTPPVAAAPAGKSAKAPAGLISFTAQAITVTGTGVMPVSAPFTPITFTTAPITVSGTGVMPASGPRVSITFTTDTMRVTGSPP